MLAELGDQSGSCQVVCIYIDFFLRLRLSLRLKHYLRPFQNEQIRRIRP